VVAGGVQGLEHSLSDWSISDAFETVASAGDSGAAGVGASGELDASAAAMFVWVIAPSPPGLATRTETLTFVGVA